MMRAVIAVVALFVVVAGIIVVRGSGVDDVTPPSTTGTPQTQQGPVVAVRPETHVIDCGAPDFLQDKYVDKEGNTYTVLELKKVSEGVPITYLHSPKWLKSCAEMNVVEKDKENLTEAGKLPGLAVYNFEVQRDDTYYVFLSAKWTDTCGNSVWVMMNGPEKGGHGPDDGLPNRYDKIKDQLGEVSRTEYKLAWHPLIKDGGAPKPFQLKKGMNRIELHTRQDGPQFHQIVISTEANPPAQLRVKTKS